MGRADISLQIQATAREVSPRLLLCSALAIPHHCFSLSPKLKLKRTADHATLSAALKRLAPRFPGRHLSLSAPAFRHSKA